MAFKQSVLNCIQTIDEIGPTFAPNWYKVGEMDTVLFQRGEFAAWGVSFIVAVDFTTYLKMYWP